MFNNLIFKIMGTIKVTSSTLNTNFTYESESLFINGSYQQDSQSGEQKTISGTCYKPKDGVQTGEYIGNFNGTMRNGEIKYSLSEMSRRDSMMVWDAIDELEANTGRKYEKLYIVGGGAKNQFLNRLTEEATGKQVVALPIEATALGNLKIQMEVK